MLRRDISRRFIIIIIFFDPGTQFLGNEKITLCNTKKYYYYYYYYYYFINSVHVAIRTQIPHKLWTLLKF